MDCVVPATLRLSRLLIRPAALAKRVTRAFLRAACAVSPTSTLHLARFLRRNIAAASVTTTPTLTTNHVRSQFCPTVLFRPSVTSCTRSFRSAGHISLAGVLPEHDDVGRFATRQPPKPLPLLLSHSRNLKGCVPASIRILRRPHLPQSRAKAAGRRSEACPSSSITYLFLVYYVSYRT